jgi:hypothetical protein
VPWVGPESGPGVAMGDQANLGWVGERVDDFVEDILIPLEVHCTRGLRGP